MIKIKLILVFNVFFALIYFTAPPAMADNPITSTGTAISISTNIASSTQPQVLGLQAPAVPPVIVAVKNAKLQLANVSLNHALTAVYKNSKDKKTGKTKKVLSSYNLTAKDIALAILDPATNNIVVTLGMQTGKTMVFKDPAVEVSLIKFNGVNSKFQVNKPSNGTIVALKYLITGPESGSKAKIEGALSEAIYVPYSSAFGQNDVLAYGANYLDGIINQATKDLQYLPSQSVPGKTLIDAIKPSLIKALVYAEHTDTSQVLYGNNTQGTIDQLKILFALNEGDAYKYSVSSAGARGIAQFMPSTYQSLVQRHPEAGLTADFVAGMSDHKNAIKAMYLLVDDYAGTVRVKAASSFMEGRIFEYGAASYNAGTTRVANAVKTFGSDWNADHSGQINSLQAQSSNLTAQVKNLKAKIKKTSDKKTKTESQSQLVAVQSQLADTTSQLSNLKSANLRNETVNYLNKIYKVIQYFDDQQA